MRLAALLMAATLHRGTTPQQQQQRSGGYCPDPGQGSIMPERWRHGLPLRLGQSDPALQVIRRACIGLGGILGHIAGRDATTSLSTVILPDSGERYLSSPMFEGMFGDA